MSTRTNVIIPTTLQKILIHTHTLSITVYENQNGANIYNEIKDNKMDFVIANNIFET